MKMLFLDIETAPNLVWMWQIRNEWNSTEMMEKEWYILCWCAKWSDSKNVMSSSLIDFPNEYKKDCENDKLILEKIWKLLDEADVVVGHNALEFDIKKLNARFIKYGMTPPSPYRIVDTCLSARKHFGFTTNKLGDLGKYLGLGEKIDTGGFKLWKECMKGIKSSWAKMVNYCKQDVVLLEKVYLKLLPYMETHPNCGIYTITDSAKCPNCGSEKVKKNGFAYSNSGKYQRLICTDCGAWSRDRKNLVAKTKEKLSSR